MSILTFWVRTRRLDCISISFCGFLKECRGRRGRGCVDDLQESTGSVHSDTGMSSP